jgi:hypothetical protein
MVDDPKKKAAIEGLKSLQDWSKWLVGINAGVIGLLSIAVKDLQSSFPFYDVFPLLALFCLIVSVAAAAYLVGAIPGLLYRVHVGDVGQLQKPKDGKPENRGIVFCIPHRFTKSSAGRLLYYCPLEQDPVEQEPHEYRVRFWPIGRPMKLRWMAFVQHLAFVTGFVLIGVSVGLYLGCPMTPA